MTYSVFNVKQVNQLEQPMFFGESVNVSRYDQQKYKEFEKLIEKQLSFFWRPEEIDVSKDRRDFQSLSDHEKHIFLSNLKYQTLLDSVQGRSPNVAFLPIVSLPELETWIETWAFSETIHSRSYTHIIRNVVPNPDTVFNGIISDDEILKRATSVTEYYDKLIVAIKGYENGKVVLKDVKKALYLCFMSVNILEAIRFYVSFACSFAFAERELMEGNAKIIKLIARDEALHLSGTQFTIKQWQRGKDDPEMATIAEECKQECIDMFLAAAEQEKEWASYLFKDGSMIGLNKDILCQYIEYITNKRMKSVSLKPVYKAQSNPIPWINSWLTNDNVQPAPQEGELSSYLVGQVDATINVETFGDLGDL